MARTWSDNGCIVRTLNGPIVPFAAAPGTRGSLSYRAIVSIPQPLSTAALSSVLRILSISRVGLRDRPTLPSSELRIRGADQVFSLTTGAARQGFAYLSGATVAPCRAKTPTRVQLNTSGRSEGRARFECRRREVIAPRSLPIALRRLPKSPTALRIQERGCAISRSTPSPTRAISLKTCRSPTTSLASLPG